MRMNALNEIVLLLSGLLLLGGIGILLSFAYEYKKYYLKKLKTQEKLMIAEIKKRQEQNVQSLNFSETYNNDLNALLKMLEGEHGAGD